MAVATLNLQVSPRRMLTERDAADYCGLPVKHFRSDCAVAPVTMPRGKLLYDIRDLDSWIDSLKGGAPDDDDSIINRLG